MGWKKVGSGLIQRESINKKEKYIKVSLRNSSTSIISFKKPLCFWYAGVLSGQMDCFFSGYWSAHEEQCSCTPKEEKCIFKLTLHEKEIEPITPKITKEEIKDILGQLIDNCIQKKKNLKGEVGDYQHLMMHQATNYPLISSSRGHEILVKQAGNYIGQEIIKKTETNDINEAIEIMKEQFTYLKAGILNFKKDKEGFKIKLEDSVYSSGVNDINMKLDTFLAGIIEGALNQSTGEKWQVNETKCLANGDDYCEFTCRRQDR